MIEVGDYYYERINNIYEGINDFGPMIDVIGRVCEVDVEEGITIEVTNKEGLDVVGERVYLSYDHGETYKNEKEFKQAMIIRELKK